MRNLSTDKGYDGIGLRDQGMRFEGNVECLAEAQLRSCSRVGCE
jgi:hypothetical protein